MNDNLHNILSFVIGIAGVLFVGWLCFGGQEKEIDETLTKEGKRTKEFDSTNMLFYLLLAGAAIATIGSIFLFIK